MLDKRYKPWLIEVNSNPALDYSTKITEKLVPEMLEDLIKVVIDYGHAPESQKRDINTGKWLRIYKRK